MARQKPQSKPETDAPSTGPQPAEGEDVTTVKCYERMRKKIAQLGSLLDLNQQDVVARYEKYMDDDLLAELAKRTDELKKRAGPK